MTQSASAPAHSEEPSQPVADYGLLADCNSAALVDRDGSIDWLCLPRYDSAAVFARMLDPDAGHWSIRPARRLHGRAPLPAGHARDRDHLHAPTPASVRPARRAWRSPTGQRGHDLGFDAPHELLRSRGGRVRQRRARAGARAAARVRARTGR